MALMENSGTPDRGESPKPAKRQRKVGFNLDDGLEPSRCITLRLVSSVEDMQESSGTNAALPEFSPDFAEHFFGEERKIYGYKDLKIIIWLHALSFHAYMDIQQCENIQDSRHGKQKKTDLQKVFKDIFGPGLIEDRDTFLQSLTTNNTLIDTIHRCGKRVASWRLAENQELGQSWTKVDDDMCNVNKEILLMDLSASPIREWHSRLTPLVLMFVEAGRPIEQQDPRWEVFVNLEQQSWKVGSPWRMVGFCTVYNFFKYPESTRLRVSQILVLPPYQGKQNGLHLLEAVYKTAVERDCYDVTMEEPSESLQDLRDCMDVLGMLSFETLRSSLYSFLMRLRGGYKPLTQHGSFEEWLPSQDLVEAIRKSFKISKAQLHRCWEVLLFLHMHETDVNAQDMFRELVTWRLKVELFGKSKSNNVSDNKQIIDTQNEYDSSKTFVMCKVRPSLNGASNGIDEHREVEVQQHLQDIVDGNGQVDTEKELQELIEERKGEIDRVAENVIRHSKIAGVCLVQMPFSEKV